MPGMVGQGPAHHRPPAASPQPHRSDYAVVTRWPLCPSCPLPSSWRQRVAPAAAYWPGRCPGCGGGGSVPACVGVVGQRGGRRRRVPAASQQAGCVAAAAAACWAWLDSAGLSVSQSIMQSPQIKKMAGMWRWRTNTNANRKRNRERPAHRPAHRKLNRERPAHGDSCTAEAGRAATTQAPAIIQCQ
jgi:hypothetical protein